VPPRIGLNARHAQVLDAIRNYQRTQMVPMPFWLLASELRWFYGDLLVLVNGLAARQYVHWIEDTCLSVLPHARYK
jgi:hypothetical protein